MSIRRRLTVPMMLLFASSTTGAQAADATMGYMLQLRVPVQCMLKHDGGISGGEGAAYMLGELEEYCNAPHGYSVVVDYQPGTMRGAVIFLGGDRITLDGSGETIVSRAQGPRIRTREIGAIPGPAGFDTDRLNFNIQVA